MRPTGHGPNPRKQTHNAGVCMVRKAYCGSRTLKLDWWCGCFVYSKDRIFCKQPVCHVHLLLLLPTTFNSTIHYCGRVLTVWLLESNAQLTLPEKENEEKWWSTPWPGLTGNDGWIVYQSEHYFPQFTFKSFGMIFSIYTFSIKKNNGKYLKNHQNYETFFF